jgi:hypothetical protein
VKILVEHGVDGTIHRVVVVLEDPDAASWQRPVPQPGRLLSEVEAPQVNSARDYDQLADIKARHRIEAGEGQPRLVRK